jgi:hypothetical protein
MSLRRINGEWERMNLNDAERQELMALQRSRMWPQAKYDVRG